MIIQNTVYYGPTEDVVNPTKEFIKTIIYETDASYWKVGSGDSCIEVEGCEETVEIETVTHMQLCTKGCGISNYRVISGRRQNTGVCEMGRFV